MQGAILTCIFMAIAGCEPPNNFYVGMTVVVFSVCVWAVCLIVALALLIFKPSSLKGQRFVGSFPHFFFSIAIGLFMWFTLWAGTAKLEAPGGAAAWNFAAACMVFGSLSPWFVA